MNKMNLRVVMLGAIVFLVLGTTLTLAAGVSDKARKECEAKADKVTPALRMPEREAFIANCLADATATQGRK